MKLFNNKTAVIGNFNAPNKQCANIKQTEMKNLLTFILVMISIAALGQTATDTTFEQKILGTWAICQEKTDNDLFSQIINDSLKIDKLTFLKDIGCESLKLGRGYYYFKPDGVFEYGYSPYEEPIADGLLHGVYITTPIRDGNIKPK